MIPGCTTTKIPFSVTKIECYAFYGSAITEIFIPCSVSLIENWSFGTCRELTSVVISSGLTTIDDSAFFGNFSLEIFAEATERPEGWHTRWDRLNLENDLQVEVYWYSEEPNYDGYHWRYVDRVPRLFGSKNNINY